MSIWQPHPEPLSLARHYAVMTMDRFVVLPSHGLLSSTELWKDLSHVQC